MLRHSDVARHTAVAGAYKHWSDTLRRGSSLAPAAPGTVQAYDQHLFIEPGGVTPADWPKTVEKTSAILGAFAALAKRRDDITGVTGSNTFPRVHAAGRSHAPADTAVDIGAGHITNGQHTCILHAGTVKVTAYASHESSAAAPPGTYSAMLFPAGERLPVRLCVAPLLPSSDCMLCFISNCVKRQHIHDVHGSKYRITFPTLPQVWSSATCGLATLRRWWTTTSWTHRRRAQHSTPAAWQSCRACTSSSAATG